MSNDLPGNAYFRAAIQAMEAADEFNHPPAEWSALVATQAASVMATLAAAHEQRTANLIATMHVFDVYEETKDLQGEVLEQITDRLGLNGDK